MKIRNKLIIYIVLLIIFSFIYYSLDKGELLIKGSEDTLNKYLDCLHFSIITQTTVGYGHIYPITDRSRMIVNAQCISTFILLLF
tara:strand:+ start:217 stop:471 length:255 start_codon:yes stop_codon:yes gene_type:complete